MTTRTAARTFAAAMALDPDAAAAQLLEADSTAAIALVQALERHLSADPLRRIERVWQLSSSQVAAIFGVSRQAYAKWLATGVPAERRADVSQMDEATRQLLDRVQADRIPAAVRRPADLLGGRSLVDLALAHDHGAVLAAVVRTFDLSRVQP